jgi:hypothetical protein
MGRNLMPVILSGLVFCAVYLCGFLLSAGKPLWLDEHYSLTHSITDISYGQILKGHNPWEGNNSPFFYATQKLLCDAVSYDPRSLVPLGARFHSDPFSNTYLRLISIFFMALAPAALFYYFSRRYSWGWGSFAALLCLSSWLLWWYGLEARPYIHFLTLTALQVIIFLEMARNRAGDGKLWVPLGILNVLLALTVTASVLQTLLIGAWFAIFSRRDLSGWKVFLAFVVPAVIAFYYYSVALKGRSWFTIAIYKYYLSNIPLDVLVVAMVFIFYTGFSWAMSCKDQSFFPRGLVGDEIKEAGPMFFLFVSLSLVYFAALISFKMNELPLAQGGAPFAHRHVINLMPVGVMAMTVFSHALFRSFKDQRLKTFFILLLAVVLIWRFVYAYDYVHAWIGI